MQLYRKLDLEYVFLAGKEGKKKRGGGETKGGEEKGGNGSAYISRAHQLSFWEIHQEVIQIYPEKMSCFPESLCETECSTATCNDVQTV